MQEKHLVDCIIFIRGNYVPVQLDIGDVSEFRKLLEVSIKEKKWFRYKNSTDTNINGEYIDGYYLKYHEESVQEKMLKQVKKITDNNNPGDEWKNSDSE